MTPIQIRDKKNYAFQRSLLFLIVFMLVIVWGVLGYSWYEYRQNEKLQKEKLEQATKMLQHSDSIKSLIIQNQRIIIEKLDSANYVLYLKTIVNGN